MRLLPLFATLCIGAMGAGCPGFGSPVEAPETIPTWNDDVRAILAANCVPCHTSPPENGAPSGFRFDKYEAADGADGLLGAYDMRERIMARAVVAQSMPPGGPLPADVVAIIDEWITRGAPRMRAEMSNP